MRNRLFIAVIVMILSGCTSDPGSEAGGSESAAGDTSISDRADASDMRSDEADAAAPDVSKADPAEPDATELDVTKPDATQADATERDAAVPDAENIGDISEGDSGDVDSCCGHIGPTITEFTPSGPIRVESGQTITGLHITSESGPCIVGWGARDVEIFNNKIGPCGPGTDGAGITVENPANLYVHHNHIEGVATGLYAARLNTSEALDNIVFTHNYVTEVRGPFPRGQMIQFNKIVGSEHLIACNISEQALGGYGEETGPEDQINLFMSSGEPDSPIIVRYNRLTGGGSPSGGGIIAGDWGGSYTTVESNILVNAGQYGVAVAGGHHNRLINNLIYAEQNPWTNVGIPIVNWTSEETGPCHDIEVSGNRVHYINRDGQPNTFWNYGNCGEVAGLDGLTHDPTLSADIWTAPFPGCE